MLKNNELELTNRQIERLDDIDNTVYQTLLVLLEKNEDEFPWDISIIGDTIDAIAAVCEEHGHHIRYPGIVTEEDGTQYYEE